MQVDAGGQNWMYVDESGCWQSMTFGYREFLVPVFFSFLLVVSEPVLEKMVPHKVLQPVSEKISTGKSLGTDIGKTWYRKKVSEPVSVKFGTGADFCCQNFGI